MSIFIGTSESRRSSLMRWQSHCHFNQVWQHQFAVTAKKKQPKSVLHIQSFCFAYFHVSAVTVVSLTVLVATQQFWKTCNKIDIRTYPRKGSFMNLFHSTIILYLIVYPIKWSVCGRTNNDLADKSQALQSVAALSRACRSSPVI